MRWWPWSRDPSDEPERPIESQIDTKPYIDSEEEKRQRREDLEDAQARARHVVERIMAEIDAARDVHLRGRGRA